ncbi:hypothetical protein FRX31_021919, partial [Thalictrum thalictroides]
MDNFGEALCLQVESSHYAASTRAPEHAKILQVESSHLADNLAASGHPILESDLQQIILNAIVMTLTSTVTDITIDDFYAHLLAFDMHLESQNAILQSPPFANLAHNLQSASQYSSHPNSNSNNNQM